MNIPGVHAGLYQEALIKYTISILIPAGSVGYIIGKNGASFKSICASSDAFFFIQQAEDVPPDSNERIAIITGDLHNVLHTAQLLFSKLKDCLTPSTTGADSKSADVLVRWLIPHNLCGVLIGRGGSRITEINQKSGAYVKVAHPDETCNWKDERLVYIRGDAVHVELALTLVKSLVGGRLASDSASSDLIDTNAGSISVPICAIYAALFGEFRADQVCIAKLNNVFTEESIQILKSLVKIDTNLTIGRKSFSLVVIGSKADVDETCDLINVRINKWTTQNSPLSLPNGDVCCSGHEFSVKIAIKSVYAVEYMRHLSSSSQSLFDQIYQLTGAIPLLLPTKGSNSLSSETSSLIFFGVSIDVVVIGLKCFLVSTRGKIPNAVNTDAGPDITRLVTNKDLVMDGIDLYAFDNTRAWDGPSGGGRRRDKQGTGHCNRGPSHYMHLRPPIPANVQYVAHPPPNASGQYVFIPNAYYQAPPNLELMTSFDMHPQTLGNPTLWSPQFPPNYYPSSPSNMNYYK